MFEVGKRYKSHIGDTFVCVFADLTGGLLELQGYSSVRRMWKTTSLFRYYKEVKPKIKVDCWLNVYPPEYGAYLLPHKSKESADEGAHSGRIACIHIQQEVEEGEGMD